MDEYDSLWNYLCTFEIIIKIVIKYIEIEIILKQNMDVAKWTNHFNSVLCNVYIVGNIDSHPCPVM